MSIYAPWVRPVGASLSACLSACPSTCMSVCLSVCLSVCHPPVVACRCDLQRPASSPARSRPTWRACPALADCSTLCYICDCIVGWHLHQLRHPVLHLRLHRGLALQVVRDRLQRVHDGHHTCHKFANVSTCPLECEFEPGYSGDGYMMCNNISCRWSDDALNPAFESRTWPIRAGGSPGPSITLQRFPRSAPPPHMALGLISGLVSCMGGNGNGNVIGKFSSLWYNTSFLASPTGHSGGLIGLVSCMGMQLTTPVPNGLFVLQSSMLFVV